MPDGFWFIAAIYAALLFYVLWDLRHAKLLEQCTLDLLEARCEILELRQKLKELGGKAESTSKAQALAPGAD